MKTLISCVVAMATLLVTSCTENQQAKVPDQVLTTFTSKFVGATEVEWVKESENEWEAEFELEGKEVTACFTPAGEWLETEYSIAQLPEAITAKIQEAFAGFNIEESEFVETVGFKGYEIALKNGETEREVRITEAGEIVASEEEGESEDDGEDDEDEEEDDEDNEDEDENDNDDDTI